MNSTLIQAQQERVAVLRKAALQEAEELVLGLPSDHPTRALFSILRIEEEQFRELINMKVEGYAI